MSGEIWSDINATQAEPVKQKQHFFYVVLQDSTGKIIDISHHTDYDIALMQGMEKAKELEASWSLFDLKGRFVNGNFNVGR